MKAQLRPRNNEISADLIQVDDHATERFIKRCWPTIKTKNDAQDIKPETARKWIRGIYFSGHSVKEIPADLMPWTQKLYLEPGRYVRWNAEFRIGFICKAIDNKKVVIVTCFAAVIDGMTVEETNKLFADEKTQKVYAAVCAVRTFADKYENARLAIEIAKRL